MLNELTPEELSYLATSFAIAVSKDLDVCSIRVLCSFFADVVGNFNLIINQRFLLEKQNPCPEGKLKKDKPTPPKANT